MPRKLNKEELVAGAVVGFAFVVTLKWLTLITIPLCAYLWALGGAENISKRWRRIGVSLVLGVFLAIAVKKWLPLASSVPFFGVLSIGYGIPDESDEGSALGRFWYSRCDNDPEAAEFFTRRTIGFLMGLAMITLAWSSIFSWLVGLVVLTIGYPAAVRIVE